MVSVYNYDTIFKEGGINRLKAAGHLLAGQIKYYALGSGTSEASSKYIPITNDLPGRVTA